MGIASFLASLTGQTLTAQAEHVNVRKHAPKDQDAEQVVDLKLRIFGLEPYDLRDSPLLLAAFTHKPTKQQGKLAELSDDPAVAERAAFNAQYELFKLESGSRGDEDASHKLTVDGTMLYPAHGIKLKTLEPGLPHGDVKTIDLVISVKGCHHHVAGNEWLCSPCELQFVSKSDKEIAADTAAKLKDEAAPGQGTLPTDEPDKPKGRGRSKNTPAVDAAFDKLEQQKGSKAAAPAKPIGLKPGNPLPAGSRHPQG